jgi:peptidoglycan/xylan/chitin deacetylase (PgdA/CDA1 family)
MYHEIPARPGDEGDGYFAVRADRFTEQMTLLRDSGRRAASLESLIENPDPNAVALTFDDGHLSNYTTAFPVLTRLGFTATFFVTTSWVGQANRASWEQLREMAAAGMSIQSHTDTHPFLSQMDEAGVRQELAGSRDKIEQALGRPATALALPGGDAPPRALRGLIGTIGYRLVATSEWGPNPAELPRQDGVPAVRRYTVRRETPTDRFEQLCRAASSAGSPEALRLRALSGVRDLLGADRYSKWRRAALALVGR